MARDLSASRRNFSVTTARSLYFGGGTPSLIPAELIGDLIEAAGRHFTLLPGAEISLEANPEDVTEEKVRGWLEAGVNRLTLGVQSLDPEGLRALGRPGNPGDSRRAVETARAAGLPALGIDLIFNRPGQTLDQWQGELRELAALDPDHISCYALEITSRTLLVRRMERGRVAFPDPDLAAEMYETAVEFLASRGWVRYEISNFSRPGFESRHNLLYWQDEPYLGFGPAAASYLAGRRWTNPRRLDDYLRGVEEGWARREVEPYDPRKRAGEALVSGLRLSAGVDLDALARRHGPAALETREPFLRRGEDRGLAVREGSRLRLTSWGMLIADELFVDLL